MVKEIYLITNSFPEEEKFGLKNQVRRAAVSVPSNIAEGYGRRTDCDFVRFLRMASGSLYEMQTQIIIANELGYIEDTIFSKVFQDTEEIVKMLRSLIKTINEKNS